jgi:hypothetical protein
MAKFYLAEMILAINSLHEMEYVHRYWNDWGFLLALQ